MFHIPSIGDLNNHFERIVESRGFDKAKELLTMYLTDQKYSNSSNVKKSNILFIQPFVKKTEEQRLIQLDKDVEYLFKGYYPKDLLVQMVRFGLRHSYDKKEGRAYDFFRKLRGILKTPNRKDDEAKEINIDGINLKTNQTIHVSSSIRRLTNLLENKELVASLVDAYLNMTFEVRDGRLIRVRFKDSNGEIQDSEIRELIRHLTDAGEERRTPTICNLSQIQILKPNFLLNHSSGCLGNELYASYSSVKEEGSPEVGTLIANHSTPNSPKLLAVTESEGNNKGVRVVLERLREWFQKMDPILINSDVEFNNLFPLALDRINYEVMTSSDMGPMSLSVAIVTYDYVYDFSCGNLISYVSNCYAESFAKEGVSKKLGTKDIEWAIHTFACGNYGHNDQILLLTSEANRCLLKKQNSEKPTITQERLKSLMKTPNNKSMALAYYERNR